MHRSGLAYGVTPWKWSLPRRMPKRDPNSRSTRLADWNPPIVKAFAELGLSRRDAAELLGLSHQRVQQLAEAS